MVWQHTLYAYPLVLGTVVSFVIAAYTLSSIRRQGREWILVLFLCIAVSLGVWSGGSALKLLSTDPATKLVFYRVLHWGVAPLGPLALLFALVYTDRRRWVRPGVVLALVAIPVGFAIVLVTNPWGLAWQTTTMYEPGGIVVDRILVMRVAEGPFHHLFFAYTVACVLLALGLVAFEAVRLGQQYVPQALLVGVGILVPMSSVVLSMLGVPPFYLDGPNLVPMSTTVTALALGTAVYRYRWLELPPIAYTTAIRESPNAVFVVDRDDRIVQANAQGRDLLDRVDVSLGEPLERVIPDVDPTADGSHAPFDRPVDEESSRSFTARIRSLERGGRRLGRVIVLTDVTDQVERERTLRETQRELEGRNERLDRFASVLSHDLRNPLSVAIGYTEQARLTGDTDALADVEAAHERMEAMIDDLLALTRADFTEVAPTPITLTEVVSGAWETTDATDARLTVDVPQELAVVGDPAMVVHVFENLFRNATDHNESPVTVEVGLVDGDGGDGDGDTGPCGFYVQDDGAGIDPEDRETIFEYGTTTTTDGTGLGLSIVADFVAAHGWDVRALESDRGGARFEVTGVDFEF